jgi:hypothetical protein
VDSAGDHNVRPYVGFIPSDDPSIAWVLMMSQGAASFTIYSGTKDNLRDARILHRNTLYDTSLLGGLGSDPDQPSEPQNADVWLQGSVGGFTHLLWVCPV